MLRAGNPQLAREVFRLALKERPLALRSRLNHAASYLSPAIVDRLFAVRDFFGRILP